MSEKYNELISEMSKIAEVVKKFPENMQKEVFDRLVAEFKGIEDSPIHTHTPASSGDTKETKNQTGSVPGDFAGVCTQSGGIYHFTVRDLKAKSARDAAKRLIYVILLSYKEIMGEESVSRKGVLNPLLEKWRLNNANTRGLISNDRGILQNGDLLNLDHHAEKEARAFIAEIKDDSKEGKWSPSSNTKSANKSKKGGSKKTSSSNTKIIKTLNFKPSGKTEFLDFIEQKKPKSQNEKCTLAAYYLLNQMNIEKVGVAHIRTAFKFASWPLPSDLRNRLSQAGTEGLLEIVNEEEIHVTSIGENLIEHKLPRKK